MRIDEINAFAARSQAPTGVFGFAGRFCELYRNRAAGESLRVGVGMISRGEVGLIVASVGLTYGIIERDVFSMMIVMVLVTTMVTPLLLRRVFPRVVAQRHVERIFESVAHVEDEKGMKKPPKKAPRK